jgi:hypothetical protein
MIRIQRINILIVNNMKTLREYFSERFFFKLNINQLDEGIDYSLLNVFLPHPHYARQHFVCIPNPIGDNLEKTKRLIVEAHSIAESRLQRKKG